MKRGYVCIGLDNPKTAENVGSAMRACGVYGAAQLIYSGNRYKKGTKRSDGVRSFIVTLLHLFDLQDGLASYLYSDYLLILFYSDSPCCNQPPATFQFPSPFIPPTL